LEDDVKNLSRCFFVSLFVVLSACAEFGGGWNDSIPEDVRRLQLGLKIEFHLDQAYNQHAYNLASGIRPTLMGYVETEGGKYHQRRELVMCPLSWRVSTCNWDPEISITDGVERLHVRITGQGEFRDYADFTIRLAEGNDPTRPFLIRLPASGRPAEYFTRFLGPARGVRAGNVSIVPTYHRIE
jgi:hypothetical protein